MELSKGPPVTQKQGPPFELCMSNVGSDLGLGV